MSTTLSPDAPDALEQPAADGRQGARRGLLHGLLALVLGVLGIVLALALPFAPVVADRTVVSWPPAGEQPVSSTALFVPYRPAEVAVEVPCGAVQAAIAAPGRTTLFATTVVSPQGPASGLVVETDAGLLRVLLNGRLVRADPPAPVGCDVRVDSDDAGTTVSSGSGPPTELPGEPVPEVFAFTTDLTPEEASGTTATARTRTWFESRPSGVKTAMTVAHALLVLSSLALLARWGLDRSRRGHEREQEEQRRERAAGRGVRLACDAAVLAVLSVWLVIAPQTDDDGYATMTVRNGLVSGDIGNYYHWMNASEAPFTVVQRIVEPLTALTTEPVWLRLPSWVAGIVTWFVVSRGVLGAVLPRAGRGGLTRAAAALAFLAWWLPFGLGVRPEPLVALAAAGVLALLLRGTAPTARHPLLQLAAAALLAGTALAITPSSVVVLAPVLVFLPRIWRVLWAAAGGSWTSLAGLVALLGCTASTGLVLMFTDQSWHGVAKATELHQSIGPNLAWYEEIVRYSFLLGGGGQGTATKRLPVLLTIGLLLVVGLLVARRVRELDGFRDAHLVAASAALGIGLLMVTPSKWSHHFGSLVGLTVPFIVVAAALLVRIARERPRDRGVLVVGLFGTGLLALAAALTFSGTNAWFLYSEYGLPYRDVPVKPFGIPLGNPLVWLAVAAGGTVVVLWRRSPRTGSRAAAAVLAPVVLTGTALLTSVTLLVGGFSAAAVRQAAVDGYSLAEVNLASLTGGTCALTEAVEVAVDVPGGALTPAEGEASGSGFVAGEGYPPGSPPPGPPRPGSATQLWGSLTGGDRTTGTLVTPWFTLPELTDAHDVAVSVAGRTGGANRLELEFGRSDGGDVTALGRGALDDGPAGLPDWRPLGLPAAAVPAGADRVRVVATDTATDGGGWLAVTEPRVRTVQDLQTFLDGRGPVLPDWPLSWHVPCVRDVPVVADGLAETPEVLLAAPSAYAAVAGIAYAPGQGGSFAGVALADAREVPSRLTGAPGTEWGRVVVLDYPVARDAYDRTTDTVRVWGWQGDR